MPYSSPKNPSQLSLSILSLTCPFFFPLSHQPAAERITYQTPRDIASLATATPHIPSAASAVPPPAVSSAIFHEPTPIISPPTVGTAATSSCLSPSAVMAAQRFRKSTAMKTPSNSTVSTPVLARKKTTRGIPNGSGVLRRRGHLRFSAGLAAATAAAAAAATAMLSSSWLLIPGAGSGRGLG